MLVDRLDSVVTKYWSLSGEDEALKMSSLEKEIVFYCKKLSSCQTGLNAEESRLTITPQERPSLKRPHRVSHKDEGISGTQSCGYVLSFAE